jgi:iron complex transport system ATP-binding protein
MEQNRETKGEIVLIQLERIYFRREDREIIHDVNFHMKPGEHWVILGRNGSGKSTLLEMVNGYLFPSSGQVRVLGNLYGTCDVREVRKSIGYIGQSLMEKLTLRDPVWEVVATGEYGYLRFYHEVPEEVQGKALRLLELLHLSHVYNQPLGTLSQGERKKVMLARSLMTDPRLLILDEPCSGLDLFEREQFLVGLGELHQAGWKGSGIGADTGIVYVTHHIEEIIPLFTHVCVLEQGEIIAAGPKREVLTPETLARAFQVKVELEWTEDRPWIQVRA